MDSEPEYQFASGSLFPDVVATDRLRLEKLSHENVDVYELYECLGKSETIDDETEYVRWNPHESPRETKKLIDDVEKQWRKGTKAGYLVRPAEADSSDPELAGLATLSFDWDRRVADIGLFLRKQFWGRGYSLERAEAVFHLAFDRLDVEVIEVSCSTDNERAKRSIEKFVERFGGEYVGVRYNMLADEGGDPIDCHLYTVTQSHYQSATGDA